MVLTPPSPPSPSHKHFKTNEGLAGEWLTCYLFLVCEPFKPKASCKTNIRFIKFSFQILVLSFYLSFKIQSHQSKIIFFFSPYLNLTPGDGFTSRNVGQALLMVGNDLLHRNIRYSLLQTYTERKKNVFFLLFFFSSYFLKSWPSMSIDEYMVIKRREKKEGEKKQQQINISNY